MMDGFRTRGGRFVPVANESAALLAVAGYSSIAVDDTDNFQDIEISATA